jgi:hypothetical protein
VVPWLVSGTCKFQRRIAGAEGIVDFLEDDVLVVSVVTVSRQSVHKEPRCQRRAPQLVLSPL